VVAANKADDEARALDAAAFYALGLGDPVAVSALHGRGTGDLLDRIVARLPTTTPTAAESDAELRVAIVGKPNVGKSSLANALLGEERLLVAEEPGTTRDSIDSRLRWHGHAIDLIDTAGLRRQARLQDAIDAFAALRTMRSIERADVCLLLLDASEPISHQDTRIAGYVHKAGRGLVVCANKWDAVEKDHRTVEAFRRVFDREFAFATYAPLLFISARAGTRLHRPLEVAWEVGEARARRVPTPELNRAVQAVVARRPPHFHAGGTGDVKYAVQSGVKPPRFTLFVNNPTYFDRGYIRYMTNALRETFPFPGSPLRIELRERSAGRGRAVAEEAEAG
jgi:GTP-binding protein